MELKSNWKNIKKHFNKSFSTNLHVALATVGNDNVPTVTPIGSMFLNNDQTGFYFEKFVSKIPKHIATNKKICVLAVNSNKWFWIKSLFNKKFKQYPALKLYGSLGELREASKIEITKLNYRMKLTKGLKGNTYLWNNMNKVRDITFHEVEKINLGSMTA